MLAAVDQSLPSLTEDLIVTQAAVDVIVAGATVDDVVAGAVAK